MSLAVAVIVLMAVGLTIAWSTWNRPNVFVFRRADRIVTPLERFAPVTLEAWVNPDRYEYRCHFAIGSDIPGHYGNGLAIACPMLSAEYIGGMFNSEQAVPIRQWSHIAAVFGKDQTRLYYNGQMIATAPATQPLGGTHFVIGSVGETTMMEYFLGEIRSVRITPGERYTTNFVPDQEFAPDSPGMPNRAVLIYDGSAVKGDRVIDLSGAGNHGTWDRR